MLAKAQTAAMIALMDELSAEFEVLPPRSFVIPDYALREMATDCGVSMETLRGEFGNGTVALVGTLDPRMDGCPCDHEHVRYASVRADGMIVPPITSGTFEEILLVPEEAQWENATAIDPEAFAL